MIGPGSSGSRIGALVGVALAATIALSGCSTLQGSSPSSLMPTPSTVSIEQGSVKSADVCRTARTLITNGEPGKALDLIERFRDGAPLPEPSSTRRATTSTTATPTPTASPSSTALPADCEPQRLAALTALGEAQIPTPTANTAPSAAESFRSDWNRVFGAEVKPFAPMVRMALGGVLLLVLLTGGLAWAVRRSSPFRGATSSTRLLDRDRGIRILGGLLVVAAPIAFAFTLGLGTAALSAALIALGIVGVVLAARRPRRLRNSEVPLLVRRAEADGPSSPTGSFDDLQIDAAAGVFVVDHSARLIAEGFAPLGVDGRVPMTPGDSGHGGEGQVSAAAHVAGFALAPALPTDFRGSAPGARTRRARVLASPTWNDPRVELWRGAHTSAVVFVDGARRITAAAEHGRIVTIARDAGLTEHLLADAVTGESIQADAEAAAVVEVLLAAAGHRPHTGWARSVALQRLAARAPEHAVDALLRAALDADPSSLRVSGSLLARADRGSFDEKALTAHLHAIRTRIDAAALADDAGFARAAGLADDSALIAEPASPATLPPAVEPVPRGWQPWLVDMLLAETTTAIDLEAVSGRPADERSEADARRLVRLVADSAGYIPRSSSQAGLPVVPQGAGGPSVPQMLTGVAFCELIPGERGSGSAVAGWAAAAVGHIDPRVAFAIARSFSLGWRDDLSADRKIEIERRIRDRLDVALADPRLRRSAPTDAILRRHADHPWFRELVAGW